MKPALYFAVLGMCVVALNGCATYDPLPPDPSLASDPVLLVVQSPDAPTSKNNMGMLGKLLFNVFDSDAFDKKLAQADAKWFNSMITQRIYQISEATTFTIAGEPLENIGPTENMDSSKVFGEDYIPFTKAPLALVVDVPQWHIILQPRTEENGKESEDFARVYVTVNLALIDRQTTEKLWSATRDGMARIITMEDFNNDNLLEFWDQALAHALAPIEKHLQREVARLRRL